MLCLWILSSGPSHYLQLCQKAVGCSCGKSGNLSAGQSTRHLRRPSMACWQPACLSLWRVPQTDTHTPWDPKRKTLCLKRWDDTSISDRQGTFHCRAATHSCCRAQAVSINPHNSFSLYPAQVTQPESIPFSCASSSSNKCLIPVKASCCRSCFWGTPSQTLDVSMGISPCEWELLTPQCCSMLF